MITLCVYLLLESAFANRAGHNTEMTVAIKRLKSPVKLNSIFEMGPKKRSSGNDQTDRPAEEPPLKNKTLKLWPCPDSGQGNSSHDCSVVNEGEKYLYKYFRLTRENYHIFIFFVLLGTTFGYCMSQYLMPRHSETSSIT